jgi:hypothetical protein
MNNKLTMCVTGRQNMEVNIVNAYHKYGKCDVELYGNMSKGPKGWYNVVEGGVWRLKAILRGMEMEQNLWHIWKCVVTKGEKILDERSRNLDPEIGIQKTVSCNSWKNWYKIGSYTGREEWKKSQKDEVELM